VPTKKRSAAGYEQQKNYIREWQKRNKSRLAERSRIQRQEMRRTALCHYGGTPPRCYCCGTRYEQHLTIAAMEGENLSGSTGLSGTNLYRKLARENYPAGYRVLCWNCLMARTFYSACSHLSAGDPAHHLLDQSREEDRQAV